MLLEFYHNLCMKGPQKVIEQVLSASKEEISLLLRFQN